MVNFLKLKKTHLDWFGCCQRQRKESSLNGDFGSNEMQPACIVGSVCVIYIYMYICIWGYIYIYVFFSRYMSDWLYVSLPVYIHCFSFYIFTLFTIALCSLCWVFLVLYWCRICACICKLIFSNSHKDISYLGL